MVRTLWAHLGAGGGVTLCGMLNQVLVISNAHQDQAYLGVRKNKPSSNARQLQPTGPNLKKIISIS